MPMYCYKNDVNGQMIERSFPMKRIPRFLTVKGVKFKRDRQSEWNKDMPGNWPQMSVALGVNPNRIGEMTEYLKKKGVHANFDAESGDCEVTSDGHRNAVMDARGMIDFDAGYGQHCEQINDKDTACVSNCFD